MSIQPVGPITGAPDELIGDLAEWALEHRKEQIDPDSSVHGDWYGAISFTIFETFSNKGVMEAATDVEENLEFSSPPDALTETIKEAYGVYETDGPEVETRIAAAQAAAVIAAAVYERLGLPVTNSRDELY